MHRVVLHTQPTRSKIDTVTTQTASGTPEHTTDSASQSGALVRSLSITLPPALGNLLATLVVIVTLILGIWSLVATWSGNPSAGLPLFQMFVVGTVTSLNALYARRTFSYVITLIGATLWLLVSVTPLLPFWQVVAQAVTVTIMIAGVVISTVAVDLSKKPRF